LSDLSSYPNAQSHPRIALYRETLKAAYNLSSKKFPQSNESLYKRLMKEKAALRPINPVVDFYNSVSLKYGVTAGAFDLGELQTRSIKPLELRISGPGDTFKALDAGAEAQAVAVGEGEVVYAQDTTVLTRHLAWRQAQEGLVKDETRNVFFMSEIFDTKKATEPTDLATQVAEELVQGLRMFFDVESQARILGQGTGILEVDVENAFY
jgi:DNA/RNA-binding domain of Phe-tRNA-synthetase-like protein